MYSICFLIFPSIALTFSLTSDDLSFDQKVLIRERRAAVNFYQTGHKVQEEMSKTLDQLLGPNYNKRIRPNYGGPPVLVELNLSVRSIVSIHRYIISHFPVGH